MEYLSLISMLSFVLVVFVSFIHCNSDPIVPALCIFGDSIMDAGNNNYLHALLKANFLPYGRDFVTHNPTGRFCNGKLAVDYTAEYLGFDAYPQPYLSHTNETLLLTGANFASAGSGYYRRTARSHKAITLKRQLSYYKDWQNRVVKMVGKERATIIFSGGIHILSAGSSDFLENYYINPSLRKLYKYSRFSDVLLKKYYTFIQDLYDLGVRRIGVTTLPPVGCLPASITLFKSRSNECMPKLNSDAIMFNNKLNTTSQNLVANYPDLKLVVFDTYNPLLRMITNPGDYGFFESRRGCCGTGILETSYLCNARSIGTCSNATGYVFWDGVHPSDAANQILAQNLLEQGLGLVS